MGRRQLSLTRILVACSMALLALPFSSSPASAAACGQMEYITLNSLHVEVGRLKRSYRIGDAVSLKATVTRPSENDPVGLGVSMERPASRPAEEVNVGVGLSIGRVFLPGYNLTNADGKTTVKIRIARYAPAGKMAQVQVYAYREQVNTPCIIVEEQGYRAIQNAFKVKA